MIYLEIIEKNSVFHFCLHRISSVKQQIRSVEFSFGFSGKEKWRYSCGVEEFVRIQSKIPKANSGIKSRVINF